MTHETIRMTSTAQYETAVEMALLSLEGDPALDEVWIIYRDSIARVVTRTSEQERPPDGHFMPSRRWHDAR
jgi:hypothetical protein